MYGVHYWGVVNSVYSKAHRELAKRSGMLDGNDFLHDNSPYKEHYRRPQNVKAPPSEPVLTPTRHEGEESSFGSTDPSRSDRQSNDVLDDIDQFGSNMTSRRWVSKVLDGEEEEERNLPVEGAVDPARITLGIQAHIPLAHVNSESVEVLDAQSGPLVIPRVIDCSSDHSNSDSDLIILRVNTLDQVGASTKVRE